MRTIYPVTDHPSEDIIQWGCRSLASLGYTLKSNIPKKIQMTPWSCVLRYDTTAGFIYLKHTPPQLSLEAPILRILHDQFYAPVPEVIAYNTALNSFLMKDAGRKLREILKQQFDAELFCRAVEQFTSLQLAVVDHVKDFIDIGVPDWRLNKLPDLYMQLLSEKALLLTDGLSEPQIHQLERLFPQVSSACHHLSEFPIRDSIVQPDFNDNNTLIDEMQNITMIDLGEISIAHPFFSLFNGLHQMKKHHALTEADDGYLQIKEACLKNFTDLFESREDLSVAWKTAESLWIVYWVLAQHRLMMACGPEKIMSFQHGRLSASLREFITTFTHPQKGE